MYLTPAALGYLSQLILALLIAGYFVARLLSRRASRPAHQALLTGFFICVVVLVLLFFLDASFSPSDRLYPLYLETTVLALGILLLLQFAYRFPQPMPRQWEVRLALALSLAFLLYEAGYAVYRFYLLAAWGWVIYRPPWADYPMALGLFWAPIVLLRQALDLTGLRNLSGLWRPKGEAAHAARALALIYLLPFGVSLLNILRSFYAIPTELFQLSLSLGVMLALAAFAISYLNHLPETTSFIIRLVGVAMVALLTVLAAVGWLITPTYAAQYHPAFPDQRTLHFTPNAAGGYDVSLAPFHFERDLGTNLDLRDSTGPAERAQDRSARLEFAFPFYGRAYDAVYVHHDGAIAIGRNVYSPWIYPDYAYRYGSQTPFLFPLLLDLIPEAGETGSGVYVRQEADRLIVTWERLPAFRRRQNVFTFQAVLYTSGVFEFNYDRMPAALDYRPDDEPVANVWVIGATPGTSPPTPLLRGKGNLAPPSLAGLPASRAAGKGVGGSGPQYVDFGRLSSGETVSISSGPQGVAQDYYLDFRRHLHGLLQPLAYLIVVASALAVVGFSSVFYRSLVRSLNALLAGVHRANKGDLQTTIPVQYRDEIGFLTEYVNQSVVRLRDLIVNLEVRVAERTAEWTEANARLRQEMDQRQTAEAQVLAQQRALAAAEEREHLSRELHDGIGQAMGYLQVQSQAVHDLLTGGQTAAAQTNLQQMTLTAQDAYADIRSYILGLRRPAAAPGGLRQTLETYLRQFSESHGIRATLSYPADPPCAPFTPIVEEQVLRIVQEALTNVRRHAAATHVEVLFSFAAEQAQVIISDDGVGFEMRDWGLGIAQEPSLSTPDPAARETNAPQSPIPSPQSPIPGHFGLSIMRERARQVGGRLEVRSAPDQGTKVLLTLPCAAAAPDRQSGPAEMRVLLVDDHPLFLDGLRNLLMARGVSVIGAANDGLEAQEQARALRPNLIVMDLQMPRCNGLEAVRAIKAELPEIKIVMLTMSENERDLFEAIKSGASGYLLKNLDANEFIELLTSVMRGEAPLPPAMAARLVAELAASSTATPPPSLVSPASHPPPAAPASYPPPISPAGGDGDAPAELTPRQWEILQRVARGMAYKEIATALHLTEDGVKYHIGRILERLHVTSREEAIAIARRRGG